jgi:SAM-dependent methyltransferase
VVLLSGDEIARGFRELGPWVSQFRFEDQTFGGELSYMDDRRIPQFFGAFPDVQTILELGCLEGGLTIRLAEHPGVRVTAVDSRPENLERARFVSRIVGTEAVRFVRADLESTPLAEFGPHDAIFCSGLLYHLSRPWELMDQFHEISPRVFLWTHYAQGANVRDKHGGFSGFFYREKGLNDPRSGMTPRSFFMRLPDIVERLRSNGYSRIDIIEERPQHQPHACVTLTASSS